MSANTGGARPAVPTADSTTSSTRCTLDTGVVSRRCDFGEVVDLPSSCCTVPKFSRREFSFTRHSCCGALTAYTKPYNDHAACAHTHHSIHNHFAIRKCFEHQLLCFSRRLTTVTVGRKNNRT